MFKCIVFDLDGTLLNSQKEICQNNIISIRNCQEKGIITILASGRHLGEIKKYVDLLSVRKNLMYIIACDGQYIYDEELNSVVLFEKTDGNNLARYIRNNHINRAVLVTENGDVVYEKSVLKRMFHKKTYISIHGISNSGKAFEKMIIYFDNRNSGIYDCSALNIREICLANQRCEIKRSDIDKWYALSFFLETNHISTDDVIYFGDDWNDYLCFKNIRSIT